MDFAGFLVRNGWTILFYAVIIALIYRYRHKLDWQARFIGLYRTKVGLKLMSRLGKHEKLFKTLGYIGIVVGFAGMAFISFMLLKGLYDLVFVPTAPPVISPVIPGVTIPGIGIKVPLVIGWLALFLIIVIHEFSHGVVARAWKIPVKSSGLMVFGPLAGAFVEPDDKSLSKKPKRAQLSVFAAGPFSNILSVLLFLGLLAAMNPLITSHVDAHGVIFSQVQQGYPAAAAGVRPGVVYDVVNNETVTSPNDFLNALKGLQPGETVTIGSSETGEQHVISATTSPQNESRGYLGVILSGNQTRPDLPLFWRFFQWLFEFFTWALILSLGIGLANLLPLGPVDGGRMLLVASTSLFGEKRGKQVWSKISVLIIAILVILLLVPFVIKPLAGLF